MFLITIVLLIIRTMLLKNEYFLKIKHFTENWVYLGIFFQISTPLGRVVIRKNILARVSKSLPSYSTQGRVVIRTEHLFSFSMGLQKSFIKEKWIEVEKVIYSKRNYCKIKITDDITITVGFSNQRRNSDADLKIPAVKEVSLSKKN